VCGGGESDGFQEAPGPGTRGALLVGGGGGRAGRERIKTLLGRKDVSGEERRALLEDLAARGAFDHAAGRAREFAERALEAITPFPDSTPRETLIRLAVFSLLRNR